MTIFKIATWNVNSLRVRLPHVLEWLSGAKPDVLALQELKMLTDFFPFQELEQAGYKAIVSGQKTYNGVAILSKNIDQDHSVQVVTDFKGWEDPQRRMLAATLNGIRIVNLYVPNGEATTSEKFQYKLTWLTHLKHFLKHELTQNPRVIVLGDFNIAPEEQDVYSPKACEGGVLFNESLRAAFRDILQLGFNDCFRLFLQPEKSYSWWDYRLNAFKRNMGLRIDHILVSQALTGECQRCFIDTIPRTGERPSDHTPVVAEFAKF